MSVHAMTSLNLHNHSPSFNGRVRMYEVFRMLCGLYCLLQIVICPQHPSINYTGINERHHPVICWHFETAPRSPLLKHLDEPFGVPQRFIVDFAEMLHGCCPSCLIKSLDDISAQNKDD